MVWLFPFGLVVLLLSAFLLGWWWGRRGLSGGVWLRFQVRPQRETVEVQVQGIPRDRVHIDLQQVEDGWRIRFEALLPAPSPRRMQPRGFPIRATFTRYRRALQARMARQPRECWLLAAALAFYLLLRVVGLYQFPLTFHADEANQTVLAELLVQRGFRGDRDELFPTFFRNVYFYNLGVSVYLQVLPYLLFGKRIWVTRGVSILVGMLVPWAVAAYLRDGWRWRHA